MFAKNNINDPNSKEKDRNNIDFLDTFNLKNNFGKSKIYKMYKKRETAIAAIPVRELLIILIIIKIIK